MLQAAQPRIGDGHAPEAHARQCHHRLVAGVAQLQAGVELEGLSPEDGELRVHRHQQLDARHVLGEVDGEPLGHVGVAGEERVQLPGAEADLALGPRFAVALRLQTRRPLRRFGLRAVGPRDLLRLRGLFGGRPHPGAVPRGVQPVQLLVQRHLFPGAELHRFELPREHIVRHDPDGGPGGQDDDEEDEQEKLAPAHPAPRLRGCCGCCGCCGCRGRRGRRLHLHRPCLRDCARGVRIPPGRQVGYARFFAAKPQLTSLSRTAWT